MLCFCYYFTHGYKIIKAPMSMFCFYIATIDRDKLSYKSVSHIPVCPRLAANVLTFCVFYWILQSHFQGACNIHAHSDLVELCSLVSTGEHGLL